MRPTIDQGRLYLGMRVVTGFAFSLFITYELVYHTAAVGLNPLQLVTVGVVLELMTVLGEIPTGIVADAVSRRLSVLIGLGLTGTGFLIEGLWPLFAAVLMAQVTWGIGFTFVSGAAEAWITDEVGSAAAAPLFLRATQWGEAANLLGIVVATLLAGVALSLPIVAAGLFYLLLAAILVFLMREEGFRPAGEKGQSSMRRLGLVTREGLSLMRRRAMLRVVLLVGVVIGLYVGGFDRLYAAHFLENFRLPPLWPGMAAVTWFGLLRSVIAVGTIGGAALVRRTVDLDRQEALMGLLAAAYVGMVAGSLLFALSGRFAIAAAAFCFSQVLRMVTRPLLIVWINFNASREARATAISLYWQANGLGQIVGAPLIGWLALARSVAAALAVESLLYLAAPLLIWRARRRAEMDATL